MSRGGSGKGKVVAGLFIGMVLGITAALGVAWYVLEKNPAAFKITERAKPEAPIAPPVAVAPPAAPSAASAVAEPKQHFEFYKVLTEKADSTPQKNSVTATSKGSARVAPASAPAVAPKGKFFVQAGSFQNEGDAEKLKAKLAFDGFEATIQAADVPGKGVWHRVRLGPYAENEAGKTIAALRQSGITATQVRAQ